MSFTDVPLVSMLKTRMHWQQQRQKVLSENVSNADMPGFRPRDLAPLPGPGAPPGIGSVSLSTTSDMHLGAGDAGSAADEKGSPRYETRPSGNSVSVEDEMLKVAQNQSDYQLATSLYQKSLSMLKLAAGVKG